MIGNDLQSVYPDAIHIIAGDFNQSLVDWYYYGSRKIRIKLEEVMEKCNMKILTEGKYDPIARDTRTHACIDHICITKSKIKQIISTKHFPAKDTLDKKLSDHFGIVVELELK